ncbi:MAG: T9SS type A sorting domain-containing protein [Ignavibacteria bacterium]|nr:T9SS type A sorting domain-containing protein [Ignavibacteria bacterium]
MKNLKYFTTAVFLLLILIGFNFRPDDNHVTSYTSYGNYIPDVMNNINVYDKVLNLHRTINLGTDSLPSFPGFPVTISGSTFEGCIFCNMDSDPDLEIVFNIGYTVQALKLNGTSVPGWPKTVSTYGLEGCPAFGDIDGDGEGEIVVTNHGLTSGGYIYAYKKNGTLLPGFPINHGYSARTPVLADIDNDGKLDIIVNKRTYPTGLVYVYRYDGSIVTGWPKAIGHVPASSPAVGDINNDGFPEIIMESYTGLYAWKANGDSIPGFPFMMPNGDANSYSSPVLADVDGDGFREIIFGTHVSGGGGYVYVIKKDGTVLTGWPKTTSQWVYGPPAVGYVDNDNIFDILVGDQVMSASPSDYVYGWNKNGTPLAGFPIGPVNAVNNQILLGDINNDTYTELIFDDNTMTAGLGQYLGYKYDGTPLPGWPQHTNGTTFFVTPCLTDVNRNGIMDIVGAGISGSSPNQSTNVYIWNTGSAYSPSKVQIPMWQYNARHTGVYGNKDVVSVNEHAANTPSNYKLYQNYPNPFNPSTKIAFDIPKSGLVNITAYDVTGKEVAVIFSGYKNSGSHEVNFNAGSLSSGVYFYKISSNGFTGSKKMILIK